jgi:hypothetical protein
MQVQDTQFDSTQLNSRGAACASKIEDGAERIENGDTERESDEHERRDGITRFRTRKRGVRILIPNWYG